ncbi:GNAT family N-acetyltransferase [Corynebacterium lizhenjunii]
MTSQNEQSVAHQTDKARFVITVDGEEAGFVQYTDAERTRDFHHTEVFSQFQGQGLSKPLIKAALDDAREAGYKVIASCSAVEAFINKNEDYADLLA